MLKLTKYFKPYIWLIIVLLLLTYVQVYTNLRLPDYTAQIVNDGIVGNNNNIIINSGLWMLLITLIGAIATIGIGYLAAKIASGFARDVRNKIFEKVESFSLTEINKFSTASLITRSTNDIQQIQMVYIMILRMILATPFTAIGSIIKAYNNAPNLSWIMGAAVAIMLIIIISLFSVAIPKFQLLQKLVDKLNLVTRENLTGLRVIRAFNNESFEENKFNRANTELTNTNLFVSRLMVIMHPAMMLLFNLTSISIVWFGAKLINSGEMPIGNMMAFIQYAMQTLTSFLMLSFVFITIPRATISAKRIVEVLSTRPQIKDPLKPKYSLQNCRGLIDFKEVTFSYPGADLPVLTNISFTAKPGQTTALIGSTGSGKSTLINLLPRFYDVTAGVISIDGVDIREYMLSDLRRCIGLVPQKAVLFSGTVAQNIKYGAPNTDNKNVKKSAQIAQADEFIRKLENKYNYYIAQGGANVSGGQKQRLSIARALASKAQILIFDDSFSALDFKTDASLRLNLRKQTKNKTVLIVGQRINTIMNADNIIVLDKGKIVGQGKHNELIISCEIYRQIAQSQLTDHELKISSTALLKTGEHHV